MEVEQLAERFEMVKMNGRGFVARCPAHADTNPSLTVARGTTGWLVKCQVGCTFFDVVSAAGLRPLDFKFGSSDSLATTAAPDKTRAIMRDLIRDDREIVWKFGDLMALAFGLSDVEVARTLANHPEFEDIGLPKAMEMHAIMFAGPIPDMIGSRYYPDYDDDARGQIGARLWQEYKTQQSSLA